MSEHINPQVVNKSSPALVGVLGLLSVLGLGWATAAAIKHNPLYSDREAYGISTYRLIEECKEELHNPNDLTLNLQGQQVKLITLIDQSKQLRAGEQLSVKTSATPAQLVSGVQSLEGGKLGLSAPVLIAAQSGSADGGAVRPIGQATMQCVHDRTKNTTEVMLSVGQGG